MTLPLPPLDLPPPRDASFPPSTSLSPTLIPSPATTPLPSPTSEASLIGIQLSGRSKAQRWREGGEVGSSSVASLVHDGAIRNPIGGPDFIKAFPRTMMDG